MSARIGQLVALLAFIVVLPLLVVLALLMVIGQGRPIMFAQQRAGLHGKPFGIAKFRSMRDLRDAEGKLLPDAERTTAIGTFLRRSRLDEVPGLWNVVRGDMAWIGPRPLLPETIAALGPRGKARCAVKPGLTGYSQISGNTLLDLDDKVALDLWYIANRSWRLDLEIVARTVGVMLLGERLRTDGMPIGPAGPAPSHRRSNG